MLKRIREMKDQDGFTLIELMVVVLIIAILIAIAIPTFLGLRQRAQDRAAQSDLRNGLTAAKSFYTDNETYTGFTDVVAEGIEPSLNFVTTGAALGAVNIVLPADTDDAMLSTRSASDKYFCIADDDGVTVTGVDNTTAAATLADCIADTNW